MEIGPSGDPTGPKLPDPVGLSPIPEETLGSGHKWSNSDHHNIMTGSDHFGFLIYVSWKMMGWVLVMVGVLLAVRCLRMWLLRYDITLTKRLSINAVGGMRACQIALGGRGLVNGVIRDSTVPRMPNPNPSRIPGWWSRVV